VLGVLLLRQDLPAARHRVRHYADIVPLGGSVQPLRGTDSIMWTIKFRNGTMKRFKFPIRTTPEGSIDPYGGKPRPTLAKMANGFFGSEWRLPQAGNRAELIRK
jgi:adenylylsulfate reductase, subunit B